MKKNLYRALSLVLAMGILFAGCNSKTDPPAPVPNASGQTPTQDAANPTTPPPATDKVKKACYISNVPISSDWDMLIWKGFEKLEAEGWQVKAVEATDSAEWAETIMAMGDAGYGLIYLRVDSLASTFKDIAAEFHAQYPNSYVIFIDSYMENDLDFATAVPCDPWEPSFISGYVAAKTSQNKKIGWIAHQDTVNMRRFQFGFKAGVEYANNGSEVTVAFTGDPKDTMAGYNTAVAMLQNYNVDVIQQAANLSGLGVISACDEKKIPCIGVDDWQGDKSPMVFWNTIKAMDNMIYTVANMWYSGENLPTQLSFNMESGNIPYDQRDLDKLPEELRKEVLALCDGMLDGTVNPFDGEYAEYNLGY